MRRWGEWFGRLRLEPVRLRNQRRRHRAAALQDAGAHASELLRPRGFGVRQPHAAIIEAPSASSRTRFGLVTPNLQT